MNDGEDPPALLCRPSLGPACFQDCVRSVVTHSIALAAPGVLRNLSVPGVIDPARAAETRGTVISNEVKT